MAGGGGAVVNGARVLWAAAGAATAMLGAPLGLAVGLGAGNPPPPAPVAPAVVEGIPADYLADMEAAGARFGVPWSVLAGIYRLECDFGRSPLAGCNPRGTENPVGAQGPGQWLPGSWRRGLGSHELIPIGPPTTSIADGFATDGDGDGRADPWIPADAVASTARLLAADGGASGDLAGAVYAYNHDLAYVDQVMALATTYQEATVAGPQSPSPGVSPASALSAASAASAVLSFAQAQLGKPYLWGGSGPAEWDCSGLVQAAYLRAGIVLSHNAAAQYAATEGRPAPLSQLQPGDLVFFGSSAPSIHHVGIYVGHGDMIDAPHTGAVVRVESIGWPDLWGATRPLSATG